MLKSSRSDLRPLSAWKVGLGLALSFAFVKALRADPINSVNVVFNQSGKVFTAGVTTNTTGSGQVWVQAFFNPNAGETVNLELLDNGVAMPDAMTPTSVVTQAGVVTYGFPGTTPLPVTFFRAGSGLTIRATVAGSTITRESASFSVVAGSATKLIALAPGMSHAPGTNPATTTGRAGTAAQQTPLQSFPITVVLTDNAFNKVDSSTHVVSFASGDLTTLPSPAALISGTGSFNAVISGARTTRTFTVSDASDSSVKSGSVEVATAGPPEQEIFPFPSPFNPNRGGSMTFRFHTNQAGSITVKVKDQFGQGIWEKSLSAPSGYTDVSWDGRNDNGTVVAAGVYYAVLEADGAVKSKKKFGVIK